MWKPIALAVAVSLSGCSFLAVRTTPSHRSVEGECSNAALPIVDSVLAVLAAGSTAVFAYDAVHDRGGTNLAGLAAKAMAVPTALYAMSAVYGFVAHSHCKRSLADERLKVDAQVPPTGTAPAAPPGPAGDRQ